MTENNLTGWKTTAKKVLRILSWVLVSLLVLIAAFLIYVEFYPKATGRSSGFSLFTIISGSMEPNIKIYDTVLTKEVKSMDEIEVKDVITFISKASNTSDKTITHRVIDKQTIDGEVVLKTQGDANGTRDQGYVKLEDIIGKVIFKIPQLGRLQFLLSSKKSWILLILIPSLFMLIKWVIKLVKLMWIDDKVKKSVEQHEEAYNEDHGFTNRP